MAPSARRIARLVRRSRQRAPRLAPPQRLADAYDRGVHVQVPHAGERNRRIARPMCVKEGRAHDTRQHVRATREYVRRLRGLVRARADNTRPADSLGAEWSLPSTATPSAELHHDRQMPPRRGPLATASSQTPPRGPMPRALPPRRHPSRSTHRPPDRAHAWGGTSCIVHSRTRSRHPRTHQGAHHAFHTKALPQHVPPRQ